MSGLSGFFNSKIHPDNETLPSVPVSENNDGILFPTPPPPL